MPRDVEAMRSRHVALGQKLLDLVFRLHGLSRLDAHLVGLVLSLRSVAHLRYPFSNLSPVFTIYDKG
jgi:hypothetical protein